MTRTGTTDLGCGHPCTLRRTFMESPVSVQDCDRAPRTASRSAPLVSGGARIASAAYAMSMAGSLMGRVTEFRTLRLVPWPRHIHRPLLKLIIAAASWHASLARAPATMLDELHRRLPWSCGALEVGPCSCEPPSPAFGHPRSPALLLQRLIACGWSVRCVRVMGLPVSWRSSFPLPQ